MLKSVGNITFEFRLEEILEEKGISTYKLAEMTGIDKSTLYSLKNNLNNYPNLNTLIILCNSLKIQMSELIVINYEQPEKED